MKLLLTGATGFIGKALSTRLLSNGHSLVASVRHSTDPSFLLEHKSLAEFLITERIEGIIHLASLYRKDHSLDDIPALLESNIAFPARLLEAVKLSTSVKWFINTGTFFQHFQQQVYSPVNLYAATKQAFEDLLIFYLETTPIKFITLKINDTYGPNDTRLKILNLWKKYAESTDVLKMSPGEQIVDMIYIDDVVDGFELMINHLSTKPASFLPERCYALSASERVTLRELAQIYEEVSGLPLKIEWGAMPYRPREVMMPWSGGVRPPEWTPKVTLREGIAKLIS